MAHNTLLLVLGGLAGSILLLSGLALVIYRESQRTLAFDRRLSVPRVKAIAFGVGPEHREQRGGGNARAFGLVLLKAGSMLAPVGAAERQKLTQMIRKAGFGQRDALSIFLSLKIGFAIVSGIGTGFWAGVRRCSARTDSCRGGGAGRIRDRRQSRRSTGCGPWSRGARARWPPPCPTRSI